MNQQHTHYSSKFLTKTFPLVLISDGVQSPSNIGGLFRISEALGVAQIIFCNAKINLNSARLKKTARNSEKNIKHRFSKDLLFEINELKKNNYQIIALEITQKSIYLEELVIPKNKKIALIIGNEQNGITEETLQKVDLCIHINMFGKNSSMNVVQATSIALYSIINKSYIY